LLRNEGDIGKLEGWIGTIGAAASSQLGRLYLESVPKRVVNDYLLKSVGTGSKKGAHGEKLLAIREAIDGLDSSWKSIGLQIASVKSAINSARLRIARAKLDASSKSLEFALANMRLQGAMAQSVLNAVSTAGSGNYAAMAAAPVGLALSIDQGLREMAAMDSLKMLADEASSNDIALVVNDLASATVPVWREVDKSLASVRAATGQILTLSDQLKRTEEKAVYEAAKGAGKDYVMLDGKVVPMPVNVVLRRQYDTTSIRYQRALKDAKYFSFLARRAIEQRIGTPLDAISVRVGTLDPPATWADDICRLSGVDYKRLRYTAGPDAGADVDLKLVTEFADSFVGDYVAKLESFVEFYNVDYPSHEGDDTAILSLKDDLMPLPTNCSSEAANLLYYSGRLDSVAPVSSAFVADEHRWQRHACTTGDGKCLVIMPASAMVAPIDGPPVAQPEVTWLRDQVASSGSSDAGVDGGADADSAVTGGPGTVFGGAANMVSQSVQLEPGSYVLSWWDQARTSTGEIQYSGGTAQDYRVAVFDGGWTSVATWTGKPYQPVSSGGDAGTDAEVGGTSIGSLWSERRALTLTVTKSGVYNVGFAPSLDGAPAASLAISSVQLERVTSESSTPTSYIATTGSRQIIKPMCATRSAAEFRTAFERACTPGGACYYDLAAPLIIDTQGLGLAGSRLAGKLAAGNFNFRHIEVSLNLVGTGVRECSSGSGPACYGTGYLEFSLQHDGRNALLIDWANNARYFDFGLGNIEHGKALAAERFITMPVSSADQALLSQPGILKPEFRGRPLEGSYRLRIWDDAALRWDRLEDVQVILKYRYWSRINKSK
jgi:hypothetical protein